MGQNIDCGMHSCQYFCQYTECKQPVQIVALNAFLPVG